DAARLLAGRAGRVPRHRRSLWLSAARSLLFNRLLAERVAEGSWERGMAGELFMLEGSDRCFHAEVLDETLVERLERLDIHPTGPLPGRGREEVTGPCRELEERLTAEPPGWREALVRLGLKAERRPLRVSVRDLQWRLERDDLHLAFTLRRGSYATAVLGQIVRYRTP
ncbi:MAG TPA: tRNA pseudouridine(13) synthase TruD, partial [Chloroflexi bacterium]|nr:tRNA pseudouridine(13) synthase TruD [Chloroflexota bacterium]